MPTKYLINPDIVKNFLEILRISDVINTESDLQSLSKAGRDLEAHLGETGLSQLFLVLWAYRSLPEYVEEIAGTKALIDEMRLFAVRLRTQIDNPSERISSEQYEDLVKIARHSCIKYITKIQESTD